MTGLNVILPFIPQSACTLIARGNGVIQLINSLAGLSLFK